MAVLMKVKSCCCGCSLELGTQIIFWLNVLSAISALIKSLFGGPSTSLASSPAVVWPTIFEGIVSGIGLYGISNKNAQLLLPYLILSTISLIAIGLFIVTLLLLSIFARGVATALVQVGEEQKRSEYGNIYGVSNKIEYSNSGNDADAVAAGIIVVIIVLIVTFAIIFALKWYFITVVYSYYCHLKDEEARAQAAVGGPGYVVPPEQGQPGYHYPPSYGQQPPPGYVPSAYGQPAAVYPTNETKN